MLLLKMHGWLRYGAFYYPEWDLTKFVFWGWGIDRDFDIYIIQPCNFVTVISLVCILLSLQISHHLAILLYL